MRHLSSMDIMLTNRTRNFHPSLIIMGRSDYHKMIESSFRDYFKQAPVKTLKYGSYKKFTRKQFLQDLDQELIKSSIYKNIKQQ